MAVEALEKVADPKLALWLESNNSRLDCNLDEAESDEVIKRILEANSTVFLLIHLDFSYNGKAARIHVTRQEPLDDVTVSTDTNPNLSALLFASAFKQFPTTARDSNFAEVFGKEIDTFYRHQHELVRQLQEAATHQISIQQDFQEEQDKRFYDRCSRKDLEISELRKKLETEHDLAQTSLEKEKKALAKRLKELDDSSNTHARRQLREGLKSDVSNSLETFGLSKGTIRKRIPIHTAFVLAICMLVFGVGYFSVNPIVLSESSEPSIGTVAISHMIIAYLKPILLAVGALFMLIYYIRWNDRWSEAHASEEFRLKRILLDIDRASWVVELALEWRKDKDKEISSELLDRLTINLFEDKISPADARHPSEDMLATLLRASSRLRAGPNGLEAEFNSSGTNKIADKVSKKT
ncbi:hypothetical protein [Cerasicoccus fimbriatus]|uniref:hypothetical protein n=1 Tax=Cerasicoccus fimbriatus TaxID=3014554 RepID=UPI0022B2B4D1|nr:hypothetical protein [Cerasicoccus sp. TK19100]